jgi:putative transcriptional regulator
MGYLAKRLGSRLRELRGDIPQVRFAQKLGISKSSLNRIEMGEQNVTLDTLEILCERLKCDVADVFLPHE